MEGKITHTIMICIPYLKRIALESYLIQGEHGDRHVEVNPKGLDERWIMDGNEGVNRYLILLLYIIILTIDNAAQNSLKCTHECITSNTTINHKETVMVQFDSVLLLTFSQFLVSHTMIALYVYQTTTHHHSRVATESAHAATHQWTIISSQVFCFAIYTSVCTPLLRSRWLISICKSSMY